MADKNKNKYWNKTGQGKPKDNTGSVDIISPETDVTTDDTDAGVYDGVPPLSYVETESTTEDVKSPESDEPKQLKSDYELLKERGSHSLAVALEFEHYVINMTKNVDISVARHQLMMMIIRGMKKSNDIAVIYAEAIVICLDKNAELFSGILLFSGLRGPKWNEATIELAKNILIITSSRTIITKGAKFGSVEVGKGAVMQANPTITFGLRSLV